MSCIQARYLPGKEKRGGDGEGGSDDEGEDEGEDKGEGEGKDERYAAADRGSYRYPLGFLVPRSAP